MNNLHKIINSKIMDSHLAALWIHKHHYKNSINVKLLKNGNIKLNNYICDAGHLQEWEVAGRPLIDLSKFKITYE